MTFTKERLQKIVSDSQINQGSEFAMMARQLLATMEQEPVGEVVLGEYDDSGCHPDARVVCIAADGQADWENFKDGTRLYTTPSAAVVPDEMDLLTCHLDGVTETYAEGWNACRAAMLQGAEPVKSGLTLREGLAAIRNSGIAIDAGKIQAERDALNAPAIPDGYALVPVEPTAGMIEATFAGEMELQSVQHQIMNRERRAHYYRAMLAAAPDFREIPHSSTNNCRESAETSTNCAKCGGRGSYHCPQMLGTVECECALPAAPQQEA